MRPADQVSETELPGIGRRYDLRDADGKDVSVIIHHSGRRDLYGKRSSRQDLELMLAFTDDQARRLGAILSGAYFTPAVVSRIEAVVGGLAIDWVTMRADSPAVGRSIIELEIRKRTGMTVAAILARRRADRPTGTDRGHTGGRSPGRDRSTGGPRRVHRRDRGVSRG